MQQRAARLLLGALRAGDIDSQRRVPSSNGAQQQMRAVSRLQPPYQAEHRLVCGKLKSEA